MSVNLQLVQAVDEIRQALHRFNETAPSYPELTKSLITQTSYWVYDPDSDAFGPSKYIAFRDLNLADYIAARQGDAEGERFDGHVTRTRIEHVVGRPYERDPQLSAKLSVWAEVVVGPDTLAGVATEKWQFLTLPVVREGRGAGTDYLASWRYTTYAGLPKNEPLTRAGSNQFHRVTSGDVVWIVMVNNGRLYLVARIRVGEVIEQEEANRRWEGAWDSEYHVVAQPGSAELLREIDITALVPDLSFEGRIDRLPLNFTQSFQTMRRLTVDSARRLHQLWVGSRSQDEELAQQQLLMNPEIGLDPGDEQDARNRILGSIVRRQGQQEFRRKLSAAYAGKCPVTGCDTADALEAAHIRPYLGKHTNRIPNGILLRADIHTLFDLHLLSIDPNTSTVVIDPVLLRGHYADLHGRKIAWPIAPQDRPSVSALRMHLDECKFGKPTTA